MTLSVVILAAGKGTRMRSAVPKVLHLLAGQALLDHVLTTAASLSSNLIVVYGYEGDKICAHLEKAHPSYPKPKLIEQKNPAGTGHAVLQALPLLKASQRVLILYGDVPLINASTLQHFITQIPANAMGVITAKVPNPTGFGRILRDAQGQFLGVVEEKDATAAQRAINEINSGILVAPASLLKDYLPQVTNDNQQKEYYLPDIIPKVLAAGIPVMGLCLESPDEILGINDRIQLAQAERYYQQQLAHELQRAGVTICDPARLDIRGTLHCEPDVTLDVNVIIEGHVSIGSGCHIGAHSILRNTSLGNNVVVHPFSLIEGATIDDQCTIGPYARIRPETTLAKNVKIGNFVEIKKATLGEASKVNHLSYVGDAHIGRAVNIGAGTITCNYDGMNKHVTTIDDHVFIGSNTALVAPVTIGEGATIGAGSVITRDAPAQQLTLSRATQKTIGRWEREKKIEDN